MPVTLTPESIVDQVSVLDLPEMRENLKQLMDWGFLYSKQVGTDPEPAWCAVQVVDGLLKRRQDYKKIQAELLNVGSYQN